MEFFHLRFGLSADLNQSELLAKIKNAGGDGIQTSSGLYVAFPADERALREALEDPKYPSSGWSIETDSDQQTPDMENFRARFDGPRHS